GAGVQVVNLPTLENVGAATVAVLHHVDAVPAAGVADHIAGRDLATVAARGLAGQWCRRRPIGGHERGVGIGVALDVVRGGGGLGGCHAVTLPAVAAFSVLVLS